MASIIRDKYFKQILLIEDDLTLAFFIKKKLEFKGHILKVVDNGKIGLEQALTNKYAVLLVDISLPEISGLKIVERVRTIGLKTPIIMITDYNIPTNEKESFSKGANIFHRKPLDFDLLSIQVNSLLGYFGPAGIVEIGDLHLELSKRVLKKNGEIISLTYKEFEVILLLIMMQGGVLSRQDIINRTLKGVHDSQEGSVDTLVSRIRKKLGDYLNNPTVETVHGKGFRLNLAYFS